MTDKQQKQPVSPRKLAANRANGPRSKGPTTADGKARASQNSYKHGFFALRLFPNNELLARDGADYNRLYDALCAHYSPVGDMEHLWVEKVATESLRIARLLGHEQQVLGWRSPFESSAVDRILRYESTVSRQLDKAIDYLERLQEERQAESNQFETSDLEAHAPADVVPEEPQEVSTCTAPDVEASAKQGSAPIDGEPSNRTAETTASNPPPPQNCATKAGGEALTKPIEQAAGLAPGEEHNSGFGSGKKCETNPTYSNRWVETAADDEMVERIKRGDDLGQLEVSTMREFQTDAC